MKIDNVKVNYESQFGTSMAWVSSGIDCSNSDIIIDVFCLLYRRGFLYAYFDKNNSKKIFEFIFNPFQEGENED